MLESRPLVFPSKVMDYEDYIKFRKTSEDRRQVYILRKNINN